MSSASFAVISMSTRASQGVYQDKSGEFLLACLRKFSLSKGEYFLLSDDRKKLIETLQVLKKKRIDLIFTTGGTGIGSNDVTVEVVETFLQKQIPGVMEFIRCKYGKINRNALLSRGVCGISGNSLIFTLPGSLKAVSEYWQEIEPMLNHMIEMKEDIDSHGQV